MMVKCKVCGKKFRIPRDTIPWERYPWDMPEKEILADFDYYCRKCFNTD